MSSAIEGVKILGSLTDEHKTEVLTPEALDFVARLHREFNGRREQLIAERDVRQKKIDAGEFPDFLPSTSTARGTEWQVADPAPDLTDRRVEITGPVDAKMVINALNSGAKVFMADIEDANAPTWSNCLDGQVNLKKAIRKTLSFKSDKGKEYNLNNELATLVVRPRGWHLPEKNVTVDGQRISASLFDFGLYFFHNAKEALSRGTGPYFYLPKLEGHLEARLWNDVFNWAQDQLEVPRGSIRATVLIETITAAFEMEEILYELREHSAGLNAGRWDYIFSVIKKFRNFPEKSLPDRSQVTMAVPFMTAYSELLVKTCHKRGAHAIGGMAAFIPSRRDQKVNEMAIAKVTEDKTREAQRGFDGTWVAHPDLVAVAKNVFNGVLGDKPNQRDKQRPDVNVTANDLLNFKIEGGKVTEEGAALNIRIAVQYIAHWLNGLGAVGLYNLMEDAATAEISRAQLWQWIHNGTSLEGGKIMTLELYKKLKQKELEALGAGGQLNYKDAGDLLDTLVENKNFETFLTLPAYEKLD